MGSNPMSGNPMSNSAVPRASRGFTLVEVMVAVVIIAVSISALLFQMMNAVDNTAHLRDKMFAEWVALNQLELAYLENAHTNQLPDREKRGSETMAGRKWYWRIRPVKTAADGFLQLEVSVRAREDDDSALATVTGLVDKFHASS